MTKEELKNKCKERAKIFQQAMECCKSSSPMDCIEWFADRIAELEKENARLTTNEKSLLAERKIIVKENADLEKRCANYEMKISKMEKGTCDVCKETEKDKKIVELETRCNELFLQTMQLTKAKEIISKLANLDGAINIPMDKVISLRVKAEQFIKDSEVEK